MQPLGTDVLPRMGCNFLLKAFRFQGELLLPGAIRFSIVEAFPMFQSQTVTPVNKIKRERCQYLVLCLKGLQTYSF